MKARDVFVIRCPFAGDQNNLMGLAKALSREYNGAIHIIDFKFRVRLLEFLIVRWLISSRRIELPNWVFRLLFQGTVSIGEPEAGAFVLSTLGAGEIPAAFMRRRFGMHAVHLGKIKRIARNLVDINLAHPGDHVDNGEIYLPIAPSIVEDIPKRDSKVQTGILLDFG